MVVDGIETGQMCIDYLRKNNLGRAVFIMLERLPERDMSTIETPENVPRLFDLIKPKDANFAPAFYSVLQNTLVADNLDQANRIAFGATRWRVVTLDGQLIDKSGTMSGGGSRPSSGGMSSKPIASIISADKIAKLPTQSEEHERQYELHRAQIDDLQTSLATLKKSVPQIEMSISKLGLELKGLEKQIDEKTKATSVANPKKGLSTIEQSNLKSLEMQILEASKEVETCTTTSDRIKDEINGLQEKVLEIGGIKLRSQKSKVDGISERIDLLAERQNAAELNKSKKTKDLQRYEKDLKLFEKEAAETKTSISELEVVLKEKRKSLDLSTTSVEEAKAGQQEKEEELLALQEKFEIAEMEINKVKAVEEESKRKLDDEGKTVAENRKRLRHWSEKIKTIVVQDLSPFGDEGEPAVLSELTEDELESENKDVLKADIAALEEVIQNAKVDMDVLAEYRKRCEEYEVRAKDFQQATSERDLVRTRWEDYRKARLDGFMQGFSQISIRLKEMYQMITMGGNAELELVDNLDPFSEGILFSVMPPKKSWKNISNLSGGEKTLSSLALVFALHHYKPTPLYVMDEIDAALDFRNVSIVANYIKERTKNAQFIVISLRNNMFELAARLVGIYKTGHMTKSITIENKDYRRVGK